MSQDHKKKLWVLLAIVLAFLLLVPIFFGEARTVEDESGGDSWRNIIYDFQTLFTGILAVGAATFTILQSRKIDDRQQKRHEELFDLHIRPDKLRLARAYADVTGHAANRSVIAVWTAPLLPERGQNFSEKDKQRARGLATLCRHAHTDLSKKEIENVRDLFDGSLHQQIDKLKESLGGLAYRLDNLMVFIGDRYQEDLGRGYFMEQQMTEERRAAILAAVITEHHNILMNYDSFLRGFGELAKDYKII